MRRRIRWHGRMGCRIGGIARIYDSADIARLSSRLSRLCWHWLRGHTSGHRWNRLPRCTFDRIDRRWHALRWSSIRRHLRILSHILALVLPGRWRHRVRWWLLSTILTRCSVCTSGLHRRRPDIPRRGILPHSLKYFHQTNTNNSPKPRLWSSKNKKQRNKSSGRPASHVAGP